MQFMLFSMFPSFGFLGLVLSGTFRLLTMSKTDKKFEEIVSNAEEDNDEEIDPELINVAIVEGKAYWIDDNTFYQADIVNDVIDRETSKPVDTINMTLYELNKMMFIVDHLNEG
jgi:hypothetical protein